MKQKESPTWRRVKSATRFMSDALDENLAVLGSPSMMLKVCKTKFEVCRMIQTDLASNCGFLHVVLENSFLSQQQSLSSVLHGWHSMPVCTISLFGKRTGRTSTPRAVALPCEWCRAISRLPPLPRLVSHMAPRLVSFHLFAHCFEHSCHVLLGEAAHFSISSPS